MTLMVGGPYNGRDEDTPYDDLRVPLPVAESDSSTPMFRTGSYRRKRLIWFGRLMMIWAYENLSDDELDDALMRLTLNETGLKLWNAGKPRPTPLEKRL